ncbi:MAG: hypothetical protein H6818_06825 [Phycisphaerales bacterium]|nr:hypothetical protein [Phycisphaerales bacterium]MCB9864870.1 hypothetical protein [Phycisphaerales bacterium]
MKNGLLDLNAALAGQDDCLLEQTPQWFAKTTWEFEYDPTAECGCWMDFLAEVLPSRAARQLLQEFLGYCLAFDTTMQKFLLLVGDGANGKSVVTEVATAVIGPHNVSAVGLDRFDDRFALAGTIGKLANIVNEITAVRGVAEDVLKAVVSGERIRVESKYSQPIDAKPTIRLLFATNELPKFTDRSEGVWRRMMVIPFDVTIPPGRQNPNLARDIIEQERPGVFNWMLGGLTRLRHRGHFQIPAASQEIVKDQKRDANPAAEFLDQYVVRDAASSVAVAILYERYRHWCVTWSLHALSQTDFGKEVHRWCPEVKRSQRRDGADRAYHYLGICPRRTGKVPGRGRRG